MDFFSPSAPAIPLRGLLIDLARVVETPEYLKTLLPFFARCRLNTLALYFENKLRYASAPDWAHPCAWTTAECADFIAAAASFGIECIPVIASLGHQESLFKHERYRRYAVPGTLDHLDPENPDAVAFFDTLLTEVCALFPGRWVHLAGDESPYLKPEAYGKFMNRCAAILAERGKQMMIWADMVIRNPGLFETLDRNIVPVVWNYGDLRGGGFGEFDLIRAHGFRVAGAAGILADEPFFTTHERLEGNLPELPRFTPMTAVFGCLWEPRTQFIGAQKLGIAGFARSAYCPDAPRAAFAALVRFAYGVEADLEEIYRCLTGEDFFRLMLESRMDYYHVMNFARTNPMLRYDDATTARLEGLERNFRRGLALLDQAEEFQVKAPEDFELWRAQGVMGLVLALMGTLPARLWNGGSIAPEDAGRFAEARTRYRACWNRCRRIDDENFDRWFGAPLAYRQSVFEEKRFPRFLLTLHCNKGNAESWNLIRLRLLANGRELLLKTVPLWMADGICLRIPFEAPLPERLECEVLYATRFDPERRFCGMVQPRLFRLEADGRTGAELPLTVRATPGGEVLSIHAQ